MTPIEGKLIASKYRLVKPIARGGMGSVWVARHVELDVDVAIKFVAHTRALDQRAKERFKREARAAARLKSPHVVQVHDFGIDAETPYIAMELLTGEDLGAHLSRVGRLPLEHTLDLVRQAAKGLDCAHSMGIVHRDVKPTNLFLASFGKEQVLKVLDFGIAKETQEADDGVSTSSDTVLGSPAYMSPEQARGLTVSPVSDVWSLAAVAYRALAGVPPFVGANAQDTVIRLCTEKPPAITAHVPSLPVGLNALFEKALATAPDARFQTLSDFVTALAQLVDQPPASPSAAVEAPPVALTGRFTTTKTLAPTRGKQKSRSVRGIVLALTCSGVAAAIYLLLGRGAPEVHKEAPRLLSNVLASEAPQKAVPPAPAAGPPTQTPAPALSQPSVSPLAPARSAKPKAHVEARQRPRLDPVFGLPLPSARGTAR